MAFLLWTVSHFLAKCLENVASSDSDEHIHLAEHLFFKSSVAIALDLMGLS